MPEESVAETYRGRPTKRMAIELATILCQDRARPDELVRAQQLLYLIGERLEVFRVQ